MTRVFDTPAAAEEAFYRAFQEADLAAMMAVWADDDGIVCIHPAGDPVTGRDGVKDAWRQIFQSAIRLRFRIVDEAVLERDDVCVRHVREEIGVAGRTGLAGVVCATNVYVRTDQGWRLWMHHGSSPAEGGEDGGESGEPGDAPDDDSDDGPPTLH